MLQNVVLLMGLFLLLMLAVLLVKNGANIELIVALLYLAM